MKEGIILLNLLNLSLGKIKKVTASLKDPQMILEANPQELKKLRIFEEKEIEKIIRLRESRIFKEELKVIKNEGIEIMDIFDEDYPPLLRQTYHPALCLYIKGRRDILAKPSLAIVGTRTPTFYGLKMGEKFAFSLASLGLAVVSGLARGIDTSAHTGALRGGQTIAVLGSGLNHLYPAENKKLAQQIEKKGAVISEFPLFSPPFRVNFPRRNRIIAGLSLGTLVIEAAQRSGALITAHLALEENREVFALPGKADSPLSRGTHFLIKEGAKLIETVEDILEELNFPFSQKEENLELTSEERMVFEIIDQEGISLEELLIKSPLSREKLNCALLSLQIKSIIKEARPCYFIRS